MRMSAYYYSFTPTGVDAVDRIMSAVACAGKAYHHTVDWGEKTDPYEPFLRGTCPIEWIQNAANDAATPETAAERDRLREVIAELLAACRTALRYIENNERRMDGIPLDSGNTLRAAIAKVEGGA